MPRDAVCYSSNDFHPSHCSVGFPTCSSSSSSSFVSCSGSGSGSGSSISFYDLSMYLKVKDIFSSNFPKTALTSTETGYSRSSKSSMLKATVRSASENSVQVGALSWIV